MSLDLKERAKWTWARWGDFNNLTDLLELLGWKSLLFSLITSMSAYAWVWEPGNRPTAVLLALLTGILVCGVSIALQLRNISRQSSTSLKRATLFQQEPPQVPIQIEFNPENGKYFNQEDRASQESQSVNERYREYYCHVFNDSSKTLMNLACEVETIITKLDRPADRQIEPESIHEKLAFDLPQFPTKCDLAPKEREKMWLFSRLKKVVDNDPIRIVKRPTAFHDKGRERFVRLRVTADGYTPRHFEVSVWVNDGLLRMSWINRTG